MFVLKEKLKKVKIRFKIWNRDVFSNVNQIEEVLQKKIQELDAHDVEGVLDEEGREERRTLLAEPNRNLFKQEVVIHQKARLKWLKHGDLNSKFFHSVVKWRRVRNGFNGLFVNGLWCEDNDVVKDKVTIFFKIRFEEVARPRVRLDSVSFNFISDVENEILVSSSFEEEVKFDI